DPRHAGAEQSQAERVPGPERALRGCARPEADQDREREQGERKKADRREPEHRRRARQKRDQINGGGPFSYAFGLSTSRVYTRRESARSTWKRTPSITTVSPRLGRRPRWAMTRPPLVSADSSERSEARAALRSAICVSAFTR